MRQIGLCVLGLFVYLCRAGVATGQPAIQLEAVPPTVLVRQEGRLAGAAEAGVACARNEYESVQIVVTAVGGSVGEIQAEVSALEGPGGATLPAEHVVLYRAAYVPIRHAAPRATEPLGLTPDPLIPFVNPYTGEAIPEPRWDGRERVGPRFGAARFEVWEGQHQPLWLDVFVPEGTAPGTYEGACKVSGKGVQPVEIPVRVTVWDFALPDGPTHENHFGGFSYVARYHGLAADSEEFHAIEDRYIEMMATHRINPPLPRRLRPSIEDDGTAVFSEELDQRLTEFVARYYVTNIDVPRAPFADMLGADRAKALNYYRSWYAYLDRKGWADRAYLYMLDEPNDADAYERVRQLGALVGEAEPRLRRLVVEQPYTQNAEWGALDEAIDIWCPLFGFVHEPSVQRVQANGDEVWSYTALVQTAPHYHPEYEEVKGDLPPFWEIGFPVTAYRIAPWLNRRYGITGLLYWSTVYWFAPERDPWDDPGFRIRWNGDGALFYPGEDAGIEGPVGSIRLKNLRDGMEDYEYFALLEERGGKDVVEQVVCSGVPTWGTWVQDPGFLLVLRARLANEIVQRNP